jgi:hypothetical protein
VGEVKHLSTPRKIHYSLSSGERTGSSLNRMNLVVLEPMFTRCSKTDCDSPVGERGKLQILFLSTTGHEVPCGNPPRPLGKAKYP